MKQKIYDYQGKQYLRMGECNGCGACCFGGWKNPCPNAVQQKDGTIKCAIWDKLNNGDDPHTLQTCGVMTTKCRDFPNTVEDLFSPEIRNRCGYYFVECPKVLVACPTHEVKEYAMQRWIDMATQLTYPNYEIFLVDNSQGTDFFNRWKDKIPMQHIEVDQSDANNRITKSMEVIRQKFVTGDYERWMNIEIDVIPPPSVIEKLLAYGKNIDWVSHSYPVRGDDRHLIQGIGCSLMTKHLVKDFDYSIAGGDTPDAWLWNQVRDRRDYSTMELWNLMEVDHLEY